MSEHLGDLLSALADGELSPAEEAAARGHLATCDPCRAELAVVEQVRSLVRSLPPAPPPVRRLRVPWPAAVAAVAAAWVLVAWTPERSVAPDVSPADPLQLLVAPADATASAPVPFTGVARVRWVEGGEQATVSVDADGWATLLAGEPPPPVELKYDLLRGPEREVAGRPAITMDVWVGEELRERMALDTATGLMLHRELLDDDGSTVREVTVEHLDLASGSATADAARHRVAVDELPDRYRAPPVLAGGYRRLAAYRQGDVVHALYSDGLHGLSVFLQPGRPDDEGRRVRVGGRQARHVAWPGGEALTWKAAGLVHTVVGDGALDEVVAAAASLDGRPRLSAAERLARSGRALADLLGG